MLGTDYVDIWHLHGRDDPKRIPDDALEGLLECKRSGKTRFIGFSCHDPNSMDDWTIKTGPDGVPVQERLIRAQELLA